MVSHKADAYGVESYEGHGGEGIDSNACDIQYLAQGILSSRAVEGGMGLLLANEEERLCA